MEEQLYSSNQIDQADSGQADQVRQTHVRQIQVRQIGPILLFIVAIVALRNKDSLKLQLK